MDIFTRLDFAEINSIFSSAQLIISVNIQPLLSYPLVIIDVRTSTNNGRSGAAALSNLPRPLCNRKAARCRCIQWKQVKRLL